MNSFVGQSIHVIMKYYKITFIPVKIVSYFINSN